MLAQAHEVAPMTIRGALRIINDEGVVVSRQGSGVFVRTTAKVEPDAPELELREVIRQVGEMAQDLRTLADRVNELEALVRKNASGPRSAG
jgi:DNA-binding GntR family transcriptional regulator